MARYPNVYQSQTPIGAAIQNLGMAMIDRPGPHERAQTQADLEYKQALTAKAQADIEADQREVAAADSIGGLFSQYMGSSPVEQARPTPSFVGPLPAAETPEQRAQAVLPQLAGATAGMGELGELGKLIQALVANTPGSSDDSVVRSMAGAGNALGINEAVSLGGQDAVRAANAANDQRQAFGVAGINQQGAMDRTVFETMNKPHNVGAGETALFVPGDMRANSQFDGRDTASTAEAKIINRAGAGGELPHSAASIVGAMDPARNPVNPLSESEQKGQILAGMSPEDQRIAALGQPGFGANEGQVVGRRLDENFDQLDRLNPYQRQALSANPANSTPRAYLRPDGSQGTSLDGVTDAMTGEELPQGTIPYNPSVQGESVASLSKGDAGKVAFAAQNVKYLSGRLREIVTNTNIGTVRAGQSFINGLANQAGAILSITGSNPQQINQKFGLTVNPADPVDLTVFNDPSLEPVELLINTLSYAMAGMNDPGGRVSDKDYQFNRASLASGPLSYKSGFMSVLNELDLMADHRLSLVGGGAAPAAVGAGSDDPTQDQSAAPAAGPTRIRIDAQGNILD